MFLQWYPGHMTKAMRMMESEVKLCDGVIYVLDARAPFACLNKKLSSIFGNRPVVYLLNKADLVSASDLNKTISTFTSWGKTVVSTVGTGTNCASVVYNAISKELAPIKEKYAKKGIKKVLRVMVCGIPNTGKSTVINSLCGNKRAKTGDKAGVTKDKQWLKLKDLELLDTPGTTPPSFENQKQAEYLAFIGSLNDEIIDLIELSTDLITYLNDKYNGVITAFYGVETENKSAYEIFTEIGAKRGCLIKGGDVDEERTAKTILSDLRKGKIGKIYFN
ncbi:MAG: ribosome biogenesis GTPase YlqF [Clostridia bacterium]|nr:ribosome biogenesis GTPase YlqF [Clostridia bacterium]